jgi:NAD-dependent deacetylase
MTKQSIIILSGAGLSAESGIKTFRDSDGLWENHDVNEVASLKGFQNNPSLVHSFYNERRRELKSVEPNEAHRALAKLETVSAIEILHVTQNIDNLCERAGSKNMIHMHGELLKCRCLMCGEILEGDEDTDTSIACPICNFTSEWGGIRPHIVWFGEIPLRMNEIEEALSSCDLFIAIGTSGKVYPAADFVRIAKKNGAKTILLNKEKTSNLKYFDEVITGNASELVPALVTKIVTNANDVRLV